MKAVQSIGAGWSGELAGAAEGDFGQCRGVAVPGTPAQATQAPARIRCWLTCFPSLGFPHLCRQLLGPKPHEWDRGGSERQ